MILSEPIACMTRDAMHQYSQGPMYLKVHKSLDGEYKVLD